MDVIKLRQLEQLMRMPDMVEGSIDHLVRNMSVFLRAGDSILICYPQEEGSVFELIAQAARRIGATPVLLGEDLRWSNILKKAFHSRATAIAGPPFVILGVSKLAKHTKTPLFFRNVLVAGYRCTQWIFDGIRRGLDCQIWKCFGPGSALVSGFSCNRSKGDHIRADVFDFEILDDHGAPVAFPGRGHIVMTPKHAPELRYQTLEYGILDGSPCPCGQTSPRLMDLTSGPDVDEVFEQLGRDLMLWTSILDCRLRRGEGGLEIELVVFPGEKLPALPTCAKLVIRNLDPDTDVPFWFKPDWRSITENG